MNSSRLPVVLRVGGSFLALAPVLYLATHLTVQSVWSEPYSWATNNISDLGNTGCGAWGDDARFVCSPLHAWMNAAFAFQGVLIVAGLLLTWTWWRPGVRSTTARLLLLLAGAGWVTVGLAPADVNENLHILGALLIFLFGNLGLILAPGLRSGAALNRLQAASPLLGCLGLSALLLFIGKHSFGVGLGGLERLIVLPLQLWSLMTGVVLLRDPASR